MTRIKRQEGTLRWMSREAMIEVEKYLSLDGMEAIMDVLTGGSLPEGIHIKNRANLSREQAFGVIWFLQEEVGVLPSCYDMCDNCGDLYDADRSNLGYIDPTDDWLWEGDGWPSRDEIQSVAHQHFCNWTCLRNYLWKRERKNE